MTPTEALAKALHGSFNKDHVSRAGAECGCAYRTDAILSALRDLGYVLVDSEALSDAIPAWVTHQLHPFEPETCDEIAHDMLAALTEAKP